MKLAQGFLAIVAVALAVPVHAAFHLFRIDQVYSNADGTVQYVVMRESTGSNGESFWAGNLLSASNSGGGVAASVALAPAKLVGVAATCVPLRSIAVAPSAGNAGSGIESTLA